MKTATQSHDEFVSKLNTLLRDIKSAAENQYNYNLSTNIPEGIGGMDLNTAASQALECGLVNAIGKFVDWEPDDAIKLVHHILEDNNVHQVAEEFAAKYLK